MTSKRAAALKAEQNAEYARTSEERFRQAQEAKKQPKKPKEIKFEEPVVESKPFVKPAPVASVPEQVAETTVDTRRKKQARPDKNVTLIVTKKMVHGNNKEIEIVKIK